MVQIEILNQSQETIDEKYYTLIDKAIDTALDLMGIEENILGSVFLVDKDQIQEINRDYRQVDKVTDVLSFPMDLVDFISYEDRPKDFFRDQELQQVQYFLGDIFINLDKIKDQAQEFGHSEDRELSYLTVHSLLHLLGYDHIEEEDRIIMRQREEAIMDRLGIGR
ncbi:MAG: rRNA maturation RNase YbeY [Bacillota bacterium]|nr:rRNA maturation RNase YbeY [Bacillota bacterium]